MPVWTRRYGIVQDIQRSPCGSIPSISKKFFFDTIFFKRRKDPKKFRLCCLKMFFAQMLYISMNKNYRCIKLYQIRRERWAKSLKYEETLITISRQFCYTSKYKIRYSYKVGRKIICKKRGDESNNNIKNNNMS